MLFSSPLRCSSRACHFCKRLSYNNSSRKLYRTKTFTSQYSDRELLELLEPELNIKTKEDWYLQTRSHVQATVLSKFNPHVQKAVKILFQKYNKSLPDVVSGVYNELKWDPIRFKRQRSHSFDLQQLSHFLTQIEQELQIKNPEDWYRFNFKDIGAAAKRKGIYKHFMSFRRAFKSKLVTTLKILYSSFPWEEYKFKRATKTAYMSGQVLRKVFKEIEEILGIQKPEDWYKNLAAEVQTKLSDTEYHRRCFVSIIKKYGSLADTLTNIFPEYNLQPHLFKRVYAEQVASMTPDVAKQIVKLLEEKLYIQSHDDWYRVSNQQLSKFSKFHMINKVGGLQQLLSMAYPDHQWNLNNFKILSYRKKAQQRLLLGAVRKLLGPSAIIIEEYVFDDLMLPNSNAAVQLDIYMPEYSCGIEYHGKHHYQDVNVFGSFRFYEMRDKEKENVCSENGITLLTVPYTWDGSLASIANMLKEARPDIPQVAEEMLVAATSDAPLPNLIRQ